MDQQLQSYISESLSKGVTKDTILNNLVSAGWSKEQVTPILYPQEQKKETLPGQAATPAMGGGFQSIRLSSLLLRTGLAFVFVYAAVSLSLNPSEGMHFLPTFVSNIIPAKLFLTFFGIYEIILSVWLLSGKLTKFSGLLASVTLIVITSLNISDFSVLFRNVAIIFAGFGLSALPKSSK